MYDELIAYAAAKYLEKNSPPRKPNYVAAAIIFVISVALLVTVYFMFLRK